MNKSNKWMIFGISVDDLAPVWWNLSQVALPRKITKINANLFRSQPEAHFIAQVGGSTKCEVGPETAPSEKPPLAKEFYINFTAALRLALCRYNMSLLCDCALLCCCRFCSLFRNRRHTSLSSSSSIPIIAVHDGVAAGQVFQ